MNSGSIYKQVQDHYGSIAQAEKPSGSSLIAQAFGYTEEELNSIPRESNLGLSCGNPLAIASLREGETVIDLGSGAGFDVFLAAKKIGPNGRAIGVDMNKNMLARARDNHLKSGGAENISFVEGQITSIPIKANTADCIISNCVINLVPEAEKPAVFAEMARLLKPGGRVAISDILARKPFPTELRQSVSAYVGCVAGCSPQKDYERFLSESGFSNVVIVDTHANLNVYVDLAQEQKEKNEDAVGCCKLSTEGSLSGTAQEASGSPEHRLTKAIDPEHADKTLAPDTGGSNCCSAPPGESQSDMAVLWNLGDIDINEWAGSYRIFAVKV